MPKIIMADFKVLQILSIPTSFPSRLTSIFFEDEIDEGGGVIEEAKYQKYPTECVIIQCKKYWQVLMFDTFNIAFCKTKPGSIFFRV